MKRMKSKFKLGDYVKAKSFTGYTEGLINHIEFGTSYVEYGIGGSYWFSESEIIFIREGTEEDFKKYKEDNHNEDN